jgi:tetratricopeptide (TPR) repeat protein
MLMLAPFAAFSQDADVLAALGDGSLLPMRWLAAAQVASRLADARPKDRAQLLKSWSEHQDDASAEGVWSALLVPGITVQDINSAVRALCVIGGEMERLGALNLAYTTVTHARIAVIKGPPDVRGLAAFQQARVLRQLGYLEEASDTYEAARLDGTKANDAELTSRALLGEASLFVGQGNLTRALKTVTKALALLPVDSPYIADAHLTMMEAQAAHGAFGAAFEHGWRGYDASAHDAERRAAVLSDLATLALRLGHLRAARRGFIAALGLSEAERTVLPSLAGLAMLDALAKDVEELRVVAHRIELRTAMSVQPYEVARALFELAQAWQQAGQPEQAEQCLSRARDLALRHGGQEVSFRAALLGEALTALAAPPTADAAIEGGLARFDALAIDDVVLADV